MTNTCSMIKGIIPADKIIDTVATITGVSAGDILSDSRAWSAVEARMIIILLFKSLGLPDSRSAHILHRCRSSVCKSRISAQNLLDVSKTFQSKFKEAESIINKINPRSNGK